MTNNRMGTLTLALLQRIHVYCEIVGLIGYIRSVLVIESRTGRAAPHPLPPYAVDGKPFTIMQFNANSINNKLREFGKFLERHTMKVAVIQESKLSSNYKTPSIQNLRQTQPNHCTQTILICQ